MKAETTNESRAAWIALVYSWLGRGYQSGMFYYTGFDIMAYNNNSSDKNLNLRVIVEGDTVIPDGGGIGGQKVLGTFQATVPSTNTSGPNGWRGDLIGGNYSFEVYPTQPGETLSMLVYFREVSTNALVLTMRYERTYEGVETWTRLG